MKTCILIQKENFTLLNTSIAEHAQCDLKISLPELEKESLV